MTIRHFGKALAVVMALGLLAGCESSQDKAARHLQSALELVEKGEDERAIVEFRNVFKLDKTNHDARMAFAQLLQRRGSLPEAYAQYQNVIDQTPGDEVALVALAKLAAQMSKWEEAGKHADAVLAMKPADPEMTAIRIAVDYAKAFGAADAAGRADASQRARALMTTLPDNLLLHRVVIDDLAQNSDFPNALKAIDAALALFPKDKELYQLRIMVLAAQKDDAAVEAQLVELVALFPEDTMMPAALLRWYISHDQIDEAEAFLRARADTGVAAQDLTARMDLVNFLQKYRSIDAALAEIDKILATLPATPPPAAAEETAAADAGKKDDKDAAAAGPQITPEALRTLRASILFDQGKREEAIKEMQDILAGAQPSETNRLIKISLARMLLVDGNSVQARALVEEVLAEDAGAVEALKLKAAWLIDDDKTDDAIALLRTVLDANPREAQAMTLMAQAYGRAGKPDLQNDMLSQAVVASGKAPAETMRYAELLVSQAKYLPAETLLLNALKLEPGNVALLANLGQLYILMADWPRATAVADQLDQMATPEATAVAQNLRPNILANKGDLDSAIIYLKDLTAAPDANMDMQVALLRAYLANGQNDLAKALSQEILARDPKNPTARYVAAIVKGATGDSAGAVADFRALLSEDPKFLIVWTSLIGQLNKDGQKKEAEAATEEGLTHLPEAGDLLLIKAGYLEQRQDIDGAIQIYEKLYTTQSGNLIVANNLASLLATYKSSDPASIERAYVIARRLSGTTEPAFADTYGWVAQLRGQSQEALPYLQTAAAGLPQDPMVQFHLAETLKALNKPDEARAQYTKVLELVPADDSRPFVVTARKEAGIGN